MYVSVCAGPFSADRLQGGYWGRPNSNEFANLAIAEARRFLDIRFRVRGLIFGRSSGLLGPPEQQRV